MALTTSLQATQLGAGLPLTMSLVANATNSADAANLTTLGLGTTTTSTVPNDFSDLAHFQECDLNDSFADTASEQLVVGIAAGTSYQHTDIYRAQKYLRLDANFAAGKYLWAIVFATGTPSGTDPIISISGAHLII